MSATQQARVNSCNDKDKVIMHSKCHNDNGQTFKYANNNEQ